MWNKRRDDEYPPRPTAAPVTPPEAAREAAPAQATTARPATNEPPRGVAAIGKSVIIKGQILSREDLYLDGEMEGTVEVPEHRLTVGPHAKLQAGVRAREVVVLGQVHGNVDCSEKIDIRKDARLIGDIKTGGIIIEDGAYFKGSIDIVKQATEPVKPAAPRQQHPQPAAPAPAPAQASLPVGASSDSKR